MFMVGRTQTLSKNEPQTMETVVRDAHPRVCTVSCAFLQGDQLAIAAICNTVENSAVICSPFPHTLLTRFCDVPVWELAGLLRGVLFDDRTAESKSRAL